MVHMKHKHRVDTRGGAVNVTESEGYATCQLPRAQALSVSLSSNDM